MEPTAGDRPPGTDPTRTDPPRPDRPRADSRHDPTAVARAVLRRPTSSSPRSIPRLRALPAATGAPLPAAALAAGRRQAQDLVAASRAERPSGPTDARRQRWQQARTELTARIEAAAADPTGPGDDPDDDVPRQRQELRLFTGGTAQARTAPARFAWHVELVRADLAHALVPGDPDGRAQGEGVVIAHPDTGWAPHPQYDVRRIDLARSCATRTDATGGDAARHTTARAMRLIPDVAHGTATGSLMVGGDGTGPELAAPGTALDLHASRRPAVPAGRIVGIAPKATILPIKFIPDTVLDLSGSGLAGVGVVRVGDGDLVEAIERLPSGPTCFH
ncbi:S8/S53 family peptidase [Nakamurella leprariae]|uniref:hypothetical protein n=1 Tax=Nakamurella leprariae TaxID=2803911 RepID=UPI001F1BE152|nr:hypothetical protein [Nakamurella leprariae]